MANLKDLVDTSFNGRVLTLDDVYQNLGIESLPNIDLNPNNISAPPMFGRTPINFQGLIGPASSIALGSTLSIADMIGNINSNDITEDANLRINAVNAALLRPINTADSYNSLMNDISNTSYLNHITAKDLGSNSFGKSFGNALSSGVKGAASGAALGPIGAVVGGGIGAVTSAIGNIFRNNRAKKEAKRVNAAIDYTNAFNDRTFVNRANNLMNNQFNNLAANYSAFGGELNTQGGDFTNGLIFVNNGGTHEENPYEGVPVGVDLQGTPNLVEEGEVIYDDYVFSNRLTVPKELRGKYGLRGKKPVTFADAVKKVSKESEERPNDPISKRGLLFSLSELALAQELLKMTELQDLANIMATGGSKKGRARYDRDWYLQQAAAYGLTEEDLAGFKLGSNDEDNLLAFVNLANNKIKERAEKDWNEALYRNWVNQQVTDGYYKRVPGKQDVYYEAATINNDTVKEWWMPKDWKGTDQDLINLDAKKLGFLSNEEYAKLKPEELKKYKKYTILGNPGDYLRGTKGNILYHPTLLTYDDILKRGTFTPKGFKWDKNQDGVDISFPNDVSYNPLTALRYVPALGAGLGAFSDALGLTNVPDYSSADMLEASIKNYNIPRVEAEPVGNYLTYNPLDRDFYLNLLNAQAGATRRNILNTAGLNRGTAIAGLLAADYNANNAIGNMLMQQEKYNRDSQEKVETFNRGTNTYNSDLALKAAAANLQADAATRDFSLKALSTAADIRNKADMAASAARSANLSNMFTSLGNIGREEVMKSWINENPALYYTISTGGLGTPFKASNGGYLTIKGKKGKK